ncbi:MAG: hypothetical protein Q9160_005767 [Pyrenula sp. 1 TL-2023]
MDENSDLDYLLPSCLLLRGAKECSIILPSISSGASVLDLNSLISSALTVAKKTVRFPKLGYISSGYIYCLEWPYNSLRVELDAISYHDLHFLELDRKLSRERGPTASILRRDRFNDWLQYESHMLNLIDCNDSPTKDDIDWYFSDAAVDLCGVYLDRISFDKRTHWWPDDTDKKRVSIGDKFRTSAWEREWPDGIPPTDTCAWLDQVENWLELDDFYVGWDINLAQLGLVLVHPDEEPFQGLFKCDRSQLFGELLAKTHCASAWKLSQNQS